MNKTMFCLNNPEIVDELLVELNHIARGYGAYDYGLPIHDNKARARLRELVLRWLAKLEKPSNLEE